MTWTSAMALVAKYATERPGTRYRVEGARNLRGRWTYWPVRVAS